MRYEARASLLWTHNRFIPWYTSVSSIVVTTIAGAATASGAATVEGSLADALTGIDIKYFLFSLHKSNMWAAISSGNFDLFSVGCESAEV